MGVGERLEVGAKVAAAVLALTYVSGYLVSTTYLATCGISPSGGEFLRAKYIYVGCQYWMFVIVFGVFARLIVVAFDLSRADRTQDLTSMAGEVSFKLRTRFSPNQMPWRQVRYLLVAVQIVALFAIEILLLKPGDFRQYLPLHALLLVALCIYQASFYREYSPPYSWGVLHGEWAVEKLRWFLVGGVGSVVICIMFGIALSRIFGGSRAANGLSAAAQDFHSSPVWFWLVGWGVIAVITVSAAFVTISAVNLREVEETGDRLPAMLRGMFTNLTAGRRWAIFFPLAVGAYSWFALRVLYSDNSLANMWVLYYGTLVLALTVLSNILVLTRMSHVMHRELRTGIRLPWHSWVLLAVTTSVLYVVSAFGFSYLIYPFVPFEKAGGDYSTTSHVTVHLRRAIAGCFFLDFDRSFDEANQFVVLEEGPDWTYLAPATDVESWKWFAMCGEKYPNGSGGCRPRVFAINRRCVAFIESAASTVGVGSGRHQLGSALSQQHNALRRPNAIYLLSFPIGACRRSAYGVTVACEYCNFHSSPCFVQTSPYASFR